MNSIFKKITIFLGVLLFFICPTFVFSSNEMFYLHGTSDLETVNGTDYYTLTMSPPNSLVEKTIITKTTSSGENLFETWFTEEAAVNSPVSGYSFLYLSNLNITGDTGTIFFELYEYDSNDELIGLMVKSNSATIPITASSLELSAVIPETIVEIGNRVKIELKYIATTGGGTINLIVDEPEIGNTLNYSSSNGNVYSLIDLKNAGFFIVNTTLVGGDDSVVCSSSVDCNDSNSLTTDTCSNAGTVNSACSNTPCTINCSSSVECDDSNSLTTDTCNNEGTCDSVCAYFSVESSITCSSSVDCNDSNSLTTDTCNNSGTTESYCTNPPCSILCNSDADCTAQTNGECSNAGTCLAECTYTDDTVDDDTTDDPADDTIDDTTETLTDECEIICSSNSECNDNITTTTDSCINSSSCESSCENIQCSIGCSSNSDCDDGDSLTSDLCSAVGTCEASCTHTNCNPICSSNSDCDDSDSATTDVCAGAGRCSAVCENLLNAGNGTCDSDETKCSAPADCGSCSGSISEFQEYGCIGNSCKKLLKLNICGNTLCEKEENFSNCVVDCKPKIFSIETSFLDNFYVRGEKVLAKVTLNIDGIEVKDATVRASGFFGEIPLYNDGKHDDGTRNDNIYGNYFVIPSDTEGKLYSVTFTAEFLKEEAKKVAFINVVPKVNFSLTFEKDLFILGDNLGFNAEVKVKDKAINLPIDINFVFEGEIISREDYNSDNGNFTAGYRTTLIDKPGKYQLIISTKDENGNIGLLEKEIEVLDPKSTNFLFVDVNTSGEFKKGGKAEFFVKVKTIDNQIVTGAEVKGETETGKIFIFTEKEPGEYYGEVPVSNVLDSSNLKVKITALKQAKQGSKEITVSLKPTKVLITLINPKNSNFLVGEEILITVNASYENGEPVVSETIFATVNNETIVLKGTEKGVYQGNYIVNLADEGAVAIKINLDDGFNNTAEELIEVEVSGISYLYYLRTYGISMLLIIFAVSITIIFGYINIKKLTGINALKKKEARIIETIKALQTEYFVEGTLDKKNYDTSMEKYESQLQDIQESIKQKTAKGVK